MPVVGAGRTVAPPAPSAPPAPCRGPAVALGDVWLDPAFADWSLEVEAGMLQAPTLLIQGADDPSGTLAQIDRIEACARGPVRRLVLAGGHSPHLEHGPRVAEAVAAFLAEWVSRDGCA